MKRVFCLILSFMMCLSLVACGGGGSGGDSTPAQVSPSTTSVDSLQGTWDLNLQETDWGEWSNELPLYTGSYLQIDNYNFRHVLVRSGAIEENISVPFTISGSTLSVVIDGTTMTANLELLNNNTKLVIHWSPESGGGTEVFDKATQAVNVIDSLQGTWDLNLQETEWVEWSSELPLYSGSYLEVNNNNFRHVLIRNGATEEDISVPFTISGSTLSVVIDGTTMAANLEFLNNNTKLVIHWSPESGGGTEVFDKATTDPILTGAWRVNTFNGVPNANTSTIVLREDGYYSWHEVDYADGFYCEFVGTYTIGDGEITTVENGFSGHSGCADDFQPNPASYSFTLDGDILTLSDGELVATLSRFDSYNDATLAGTWKTSHGDPASVHDQTYLVMNGSGNVDELGTFNFISSTYSVDPSGAISFTVNEVYDGTSNCTGQLTSMHEGTLTCDGGTPTTISKIEDIGGCQGNWSGTLNPDDPLMGNIDVNFTVGFDGKILESNYGALEGRAFCEDGSFFGFTKTTSLDAYNQIRFAGALTGNTATGSYEIDNENATEGVFSFTRSEPNPVQAAGLSGYWALTDAGETTPDFVYLSENNGVINGSFVCDTYGDPVASITGTATGNTFSASWIDEPNLATINATVSGENMEGTWTEGSLGSGTFTGYKLASNPCAEMVDALIEVTESSPVGNSGNISVFSMSIGGLREGRGVWGGHSPSSPFFYLFDTAHIYLPFMPTDKLSEGTQWTEDGHTWDWYTNVSTSTVMSTNVSVQTQSLAFDNCIEVMESIVYDDPNVPHAYYMPKTITRFYKDGVGIVKVVHEKMDGSVSTGELIDYDVSNGGVSVMPLAQNNSWTYLWNNGVQETYTVTDTVVTTHP